MKSFLDWLTKLQPLALNASRIVVGFTFWTHGGQKLFAWFGRDEPVQLMSRFGAAGIIEFFGGLLIIFGAFMPLVTGRSGTGRIGANFRRCTRSSSCCSPLTVAVTSVSMGC